MVLLEQELPHADDLVLIQARDLVLVPNLVRSMQKQKVYMRITFDPSVVVYVQLFSTEKTQI